MSSCLDNIISVRACNPDDTPASLSGLDLFDAPEISTSTLANMANEEYIKGRTLATAKVSLATKLISNDLKSVMAANNLLPNLTDITYNAATFKTSTTFLSQAVDRGLVFHKAGNVQGSLRKHIIHNVYTYPLTDATGVTLSIWDSWAGGTLTEYEIDLTADEVNTHNVEYTVLGSYARVYINGDGLSFASSYLTCFTGCDGRRPNNCGFVKGYFDGREVSRKEGYGISIDFSCVCDYDEMLCGLAKTTLGTLVWLKARILLMEERLETDRLNNFIVWGREDAKDKLKELKAEYIMEWNTFANSVPSIVENMRDSCLNCRGSRWKTNI